MAQKILIGLTGRGYLNGVFASTARVGKDEVANVIKNLGFRTYSFALPLKQTSQVLFGLNDDQMWNDKLKNVIIENWGLSPRTIFQRMGTEGGRNIFDSDMWARMAMFVWDDVKQDRPYTLTHTSESSQWSNKTPSSPEDFTAILHMAARTMFQLDDRDIAQSLSTGAPLSRWPFSFEHVVETIRTKTIPSILQLPPDEAWLEFIKIRSLLPFIEKVSNGPYGIPPQYAKGMVVPDNRFDNEACIIRENGGAIVHVCRELPTGIELVQGHASEQGVTPVDTDKFIYNDGTLEDLRIRTINTIYEIGFQVTNDNSNSFQI